MAKTTQTGRLLSINTALGEDVLLIDKIVANEGISRLFEIEVDLLHDDEEYSLKPTQLDVNSILGQPATISIQQHDGGARFFNGIFRSLSYCGRRHRFSFYRATIVPRIWELTQIRQSRIFQQKSVRDILSTVFKGYEFRLDLVTAYQPRNYCVQYNETDFDFASRLMEEEGISYYFENAERLETLVITDNYQRPKDCPNKSAIPMIDENLSDEIFETAIKSLILDYRFQTGKVTLWDYNFQLPGKRNNVEQLSRYSVGGNTELEDYQFPGGYARKYDGISKGGGESASDLSKISVDNQRTIKNRIEGIDSRYTTIRGLSDCCTLTAGHRFTMKNHPNSEYNMPYILTSIHHEADQNPKYESEENLTEAYHNSFECIAHGSGRPEFRPPLNTPKPVMPGSQTAFVVGPAGEEIFTDKYGRVKVQFHWDRDGKVDSDSSCWVRVAQTWAGNRWGAMFIPRIGMEVLVDFIEGDPDLPVITGCVYNPASMPAYVLPDEKTKSGIKSNSTKGGGGFNEFRLEDKKGSEQIFVHGEKDLDVRIKNDAKEIILRDRHLIVERDQIEKVKRDKSLTVTGDQNENVGGSYSLKVGSNIQEKAEQKIAFDAGTEIHLKAGMAATIEASTSLTLKVGGNFININAGGIFIKGTMVMINSGGAAGSGSGASPSPPKEPLEAVNAESGKTVINPEKPPAPVPKKRSPKAEVMAAASQKGTPFMRLG